MKKVKNDKHRRGRPLEIPTHCGFREDPDWFLDVKIAVDRWCRENDRMHHWKDAQNRRLNNWNLPDKRLSERTTWVDINLNCPEEDAADILKEIKLNCLDEYVEGGVE